MSWKMNSQEFNSVISIDPPKRYSYCIKRIVDFEELWSLWTIDGWALTSDSQGNELVPIWPHEKFASACASGAWVGYEPRTISLSDWINRWIPGMTRDKRLVAVFPTPEGKGIVVSPDRIKDDLESEMSLYE